MQSWMLKIKSIHAIYSARISEGNLIMKILVTGAAGFIGHYVCSALLISGHTVVGIDNLNNYYDANLKLARLQNLLKIPNFSFFPLDINDVSKLDKPNFSGFDIIIHLAAQAGVRYSITNPEAYVHSNLDGHLQILEYARKNKPKLLIYASSSSVYGNNSIAPFKEDAKVNEPESFYAATKASNEIMSASYAKLYGISQIGLRFFTVYGPWGRPDMAYWSFTDRILKGETIKVFNNGNLMRDFTYIDDIVEGIVRIVTNEADFSQERIPHKIYNIGNNSPVKLMDFINTIEECLGIKANIEFLPMQLGDVYETSADVSKLAKDYDFKPNTELSKGIKIFADWFKEWNK